MVQKQISVIIMLKKMILELIIIALVVVPISAVQADDQYTIYLKSRSFTPKPGIEPEAKVTLDKSAILGTRSVLMCQFYIIPDKTQRHNLERTDIKLLEYIPNNTWLISVPLKPIEVLVQSLSDVTFSNIRWLGTLLALDKIESSLVERIKSQGEKECMINLWIDFFKDVPLNTAHELVISYEGQIIEEIPELSRLIVNLPTTAVLKLANENSVQWIMQEPSPPQTVNDGMLGF